MLGYDPKELIIHVFSKKLSNYRHISKDNEKFEKNLKFWDIWKKIQKYVKNLDLKEYKIQNIEIY